MGRMARKNRSIAVFIVSSADNDLVLEESNRFLYKLDNEIDRISSKISLFSLEKAYFPVLKYLEENTFFFYNTNRRRKEGVSPVCLNRESPADEK